MKLQDVLFLIIFLFLLWKKNPRWFAVAGLISLVLAIPLFVTWTFFTAERLTWYSAAFFLIAIVLFVLKGKKR